MTDHCPGSNATAALAAAKPDLVRCPVCDRGLPAVLKDAPASTTPSAGVLAEIQGPPPAQSVTVPEHAHLDDLVADTDETAQDAADLQAHDLKSGGRSGR